MFCDYFTYFPMLGLYWSCNFRWSRYGNPFVTSRQTSYIKNSRVDPRVEPSRSEIGQLSILYVIYFFFTYLQSLWLIII